MYWGVWLSIFIAGVGSLYQVLSYYQAKRTTGQGAFNMRRPYVVAGIFMLLTWAAVGYDLYNRFSYPSFQWDTQPAIQIRNRTFRAETVHLDDREFIDCIFSEVTFVYEGTAPTRLINSHVSIHHGSEKMGIGVRSDNPTVQQTVELVYSLLQSADAPMPGFEMERKVEPSP